MRTLKRLRHWALLKLGAGPTLVVVHTPDRAAHVTRLPAGWTGTVDAVVGPAGDLTWITNEGGDTR